MSSMMPDVKEVLIPSSEVQEKVRELGERITEDYEGERLLLVGILRGAVVVMSDLMRNIDLPCELDFMDISSYGSGTSSSGVVRILKDLEEDITDRHVLVVEDDSEMRHLIVRLLRENAFAASSAASLVGGLATLAFDYPPRSRFFRSDSIAAAVTNVAPSLLMDQRLFDFRSLSSMNGFQPDEAEGDAWLDQEPDSHQNLDGTLLLP